MPGSPKKEDAFPMSLSTISKHHVSGQTSRRTMNQPKPPHTSSSASAVRSYGANRAKAQGWLRWWCCAVLWSDLKPLVHMPGMAIVAGVGGPILISIPRDDAMPHTFVHVDDKIRHM